MDRREFLLNTAKASGVVLPWWGVVPLANAQSNDGPILIDIHAGGGIDHGSWLDPDDRDPAMNFYAQRGTPNVGPGIPGCQLQMAPMGNHGAFLAANFMDMLVVKNLNTETNSHENGDQASATGKLEMGFATLCELHAAKYGVGKPMAWLAQGGTFQISAGLSVPTPVPGPDQLRSSIVPNASSATSLFVKQADFDKTLAVRDARLQALKASGITLPRERLINDQFISAKEARARLAAVAQNIPATIDQNFPAAQVALIAAQSGIMSSALLQVGGFDAHGGLENAYNGANGALTRLTNTIQFIRDEAAARGIINRLYIMVRSEFGRTPINGGLGKDHDNKGGTVLIVLPPGSGLGNRAIGATGMRSQNLAINTTTGAVDPNGVILRPRHVHASLRNRLGIGATNPAQGLGVPASEQVDLFNANVRTGYPARA